MQALEDRPDLGEWQWVMDAFSQLHAARSAGFVGAEPLRPDAILAWLEIHRVDDVDVRAEFYRLITALDLAWIKLRMESAK